MSTLDSFQTPGAIDVAKLLALVKPDVMGWINQAVANSVLTGINIQTSVDGQDIRPRSVLADIGNDTSTRAIVGVGTFDGNAQSQWVMWNRGTSAGTGVGMLMGIGNPIKYIGGVLARLQDATAGAEYADVVMRAMVNGTLTEIASFYGNGIKIGFSDGTVTPDSALEIDAGNSGYITLNEIAAPSSPAANKLAVYCVDVGGVTKLATKDSTGTVKVLSDGAVSGSDKYVQFNDGGSFGGESVFTYNKASQILTFTYGTIGSILTGSGTFNLVDATATIINFGGAGTTISIGAATGYTKIRNSVTIGDVALPSGGGTPVLVFKQVASNPTGLASNTAGHFAKDVAGTCEMFSVDEAGNVTQNSPHANPDLAAAAGIEVDPNDPYPRIEYEFNVYLGVEAFTYINPFTGKYQRVVRDLPPELIQDWDAVHAEHAQRRLTEIEEFDTLKPIDRQSKTRPKPYVIKQLPKWIDDRLEAKQQQRVSK